MHAYEPTFLSRSPVLARGLRAVVGVGVAALAVAAWGTAGPGNYNRTALVRVTLPPVVVTAQREAPALSTAAVAGCSRAQVDAGRTARKLG
ncbi:MAG: hypothetical protein ACJ8GO_00435 [Ramlibacter sp.]